MLKNGAKLAHEKVSKIMALNPRLTPPNKNADANQWINWYDQLESNFGKKDAATAFTTRWSIVKSDLANDNTLRTYMAKQGIEIKAGGLFGSLEDTTKNLLGGVGDFLKLGMIGAYVISFILLVFVLLVVWRLAKPEAVGTVIKYAK